MIKRKKMRIGAAGHISRGFQAYLHVHGHICEQTTSQPSVLTIVSCEEGTEKDRNFCWFSTKIHAKIEKFWIVRVTPPMLIWRKVDINGDSGGMGFGNSIDQRA
ncbi:hypothetical protein WL28_11675 [Burkholderia ubonensis]|nr:hypothetical protein WJ83_18340 [Burkholderia ubonensis]KVP44223.1 hypothetical protein WJ87_31310 [Burkholderia ubonensis]KWA71763.1 hypothetical protein WL28_11675 [Burkholderia ubonensis]